MKKLFGPIATIIQSIWSTLQWIIGLVCYNNFLLLSDKYSFLILIKDRLSNLSFENEVERLCYEGLSVCQSGTFPFEFKLAESQNKYQTSDSKLKERSYLTFYCIT